MLNVEVVSNLIIHLFYDRQTDGNGNGNMRTIKPKKNSPRYKTGKCQLQCV